MRIAAPNSFFCQQPPKSRAPKRKPGRPSNVSRAQDAPRPEQREASNAEDEDEIASADNPENAHGPRKRRRRGDASDEEEGAPAPKRRGRGRQDTTDAGDEVEARQAEPKKRGRPRRTKATQSEPADGSPDAEQPSGRKRRRFSGEDAESNNEGELDGETATKRRRGRASLDKAPAEATHDRDAGPATRIKRGKPKATQDGDTPAETEQPRRRGRPRRSDSSNVANSEGPGIRAGERRTDEAEADSEPTEPRKKGWPRRSDGSDAAAEQQSQPKKRGRPRRSDTADTAEQPEPKKQGRPRPSDTSDAAAEPPEPRKRGRPRRSDISDEKAPQARPSTTEANQEPSPEASPDQPQKRPYTYLAPKQRDIPVSTISSTWTPLQPPALATARQILQLSTRPVLQALAPGPRRDAASSAIRAATKRLSSKLSKGLPFPPASRAAAKAAKRSKVPRADGREAELDFEAVAAEMEALEGRLQPLLHSIEVLSGEEKRLEKVLEKEAAELEVLARNGREERKVWREGLRRKGHPLVPDQWDPDGDGRDRLALAPKEVPPSEWLFAVCLPSLHPFPHLSKGLGVWRLHITTAGPSN